MPFRGILIAIPFGLTFWVLLGSFVRRVWP